MFTSLRREDAAAGIRFAQTVLTLVILVMSVACLVLLLLAPATVTLIAPGFDAGNRERYLELFRLMLITPIVFAASIALGEILVAERRFLPYALAPILYNVGIVAGTVLLHDRIGIMAAAVGAVIGAFLHLGIRVVGMLRSSVPMRPRLDLHLPALREFLRLMVPKMLSHPIEPLTFLFFTNVATTLAAGSVTAISFARNFQSVPVALFGVSISLAAFPALSAAWAAGDRSGFRRQVRTSATTITVLAVAAAVGLFIVGPLLIEVLLGGGSFDAEDVGVTAAVLAAFALAVPFDALGHLTARGLYATHNTVLPVLASLAGFAVTVAVTLALVEPVDILAIPLGFAAGTAVRTGLQGLLLARRMHGDAPAQAGRAGPAEAPPRATADGGRRGLTLSGPGSRSAPRRGTARRGSGTSPPAASTAGSCGASRPRPGRPRAGPTDPRSSRSADTRDPGCRPRTP